jgi:hypothetical protein
LFDQFARRDARRYGIQHAQQFRALHLHSVPFVVRSDVVSLRG